MSHPFIFRPNTEDEQVLPRAVNTHNEYRLPKTFQGDDVIIDIGTHIGSFCYASRSKVGQAACMARRRAPRTSSGAGKTWNRLATRVHLRHGRGLAVGPEGAREAPLRGSAWLDNNGGGQVPRDIEGPSVAAVAFDDVVREVTRGGRTRVRMVKVDCEGAEYPILLTSKTLHLVDAIVGEFHEFGSDDEPHPDVNEILRVPGHDRFTIKVLKKALESAGFDVVVEYHPGYPREPLGWWWVACRQPSAIPAPALSRWARLGRKVRTLVR